MDGLGLFQRLSQNTRGQRIRSSQDFQDPNPPACSLLNQCSSPLPPSNQVYISLPYHVPPNKRNGPSLQAKDLILLDLVKQKHCSLKERIVFCRVFGLVGYGIGVSCLPYEDHKSDSSWVSNRLPLTASQNDPPERLKTTNKTGFQIHVFIYQLFRVNWRPRQSPTRGHVAVLPDTAKRKRGGCGLA